MPDLEKLLTSSGPDRDPAAALQVGTVVSADATGIVVRLRGANTPKLSHVKPITAAPAAGAVVAVIRQGAQLVVLGTVQDAF